jgi:hypothetical protein
MVDTEIVSLTQQHNINAIARQPSVMIYTIHYDAKCLHCNCFESMAAMAQSTILLTTLCAVSRLF